MTAASKSRLRIFAIMLFAIAIFPARAEAHLNSTGMGPVYDGLMHFLTSPEDVVPVLGLALLAGLRGANYGRRALLVLPATWLAGGLAGLTVATANSSAAVTAITFLLLGGLVAMDTRLSLRVITALAGLIGLYHGYLNGAGMGQPGTASVALLGLVFAVFVLVALAAALVVQLQAAWARIAVRVVGSWIVASGLLMLGWNLRGKL
jgi:hydrogenase/urease accessory protein HupE